LTVDLNETLQFNGSHSLARLSANTDITPCFCFTRFLSSKSPQLRDHRRLFKYLIFENTEYLKGLRNFDTIYDIFVNWNWVVTRWQYTFTHKLYIEQHKLQLIWKSAGRALSLRVLPWHLPYNRGKSTEKPANLNGIIHKYQKNSPFILQNVK
jgi:hypothetical protein